MEYREFRAEDVGVDDEGVLEGLVTPFGRETVIGDLNRGGFHEEISRGAFTKTLAEGDPLLVYQHDLTKPLARKSAGNLDMHEGELDGVAGLVMRAKPVDTSYARDLRALVKAKVIQGMSFGFNVVKDEWVDAEGRAADKQTGTKRFIREVKLIEGSPVTRPAYEGTAISARDDATALLEARERAAGTSAADRASMPYGNVAYADPKHGKYPIDRVHVKAAWSYVNQKANAAKYPWDGVTLDSVKNKIKKAMAKFGFTVSDEKKSFEFSSAEWRDDDPYLDDFYEIDDDTAEGTGGEPRGEDNSYAKFAEAILASRSDAMTSEVVDLGNGSFCIILRDDPDGKEYAAIDEALRHLRGTPPDVKSAVGCLSANQSARRDDPDGREFKCIDDALRFLRESPPDVKGAISTLQANQAYGRGRGSSMYDRSTQEPEASTPDEDDDLALSMAMRSREIELGL